MAEFSQKSLSKLDTCHHDLQILAKYVVKYWDCSVIHGLRTKEEQDDLYAKGYSKLKFPNSKHNVLPLSHAVDLVPYPSLYSSEKNTLAFSGYVLGVADFLYETGVIKHRIKSGGDWNLDRDYDDTRFWDPLHFEII
jgi:peptidoglycan L-alanyl-D-glutamate endopeptidase CwlK